MPDYGASSGQGMGQMIQMIATLSEMQDRRKKLALDQQQMEQQKEQFAAQLGLQKDSEHWKKAQNLLEAISNGGADAATAVHDLAPLAGFSPQEAQLFAHVAPSASAAMQLFQRHTQEAGRASMTPEQGKLADQSALLANQAPGQTVFGQATQQAALDAPGMANKAAVLQYGGAMTDAQSANSQLGFADLNERSIHDAQSIAIQRLLAMTKPAGGVGGTGGANQDLNAYTNAIAQLNSLTQQMAKAGDKRTNMIFASQYNSLAGMIGLPLIKGEDDIPQAVGMLKNLSNQIGHQNTPELGPTGSFYQPPAMQPPMQQPQTPIPAFNPVGGIPPMYR